MKSPPSLAKIQVQFANALLHPDDATEVVALFKPDPHQDDRLALYRGNLTAIWKSALRNAYPVLYQLVGEEYFEQLARVFGRAYPSESGDLNQFGARLPEFLKVIPDAADYPYFADVAALEWKIHCAYYAADVEILSLSGLLQIVAERELDLQMVQLELHTAVSLIYSEWAVVSIWQAHQDKPGNADIEDVRKASFGVVSRLNWSVTLHPLSRAEYLALLALQRGVTLAKALEIAVDEDGEFNVNTHLQTWFAAGLFKGCKSKA